MKIDYKLLKQTCLSGMSQFYQYGVVTTTPDGIYIHKDNGSKILGIAHLDSVLHLKHFYHLKIAGEHLVFNAQLDDRLGAYVLLHILPKMGIKFDLLLTEGEESCRSTAAYFEPSHNYNWMFSFDRHGSDVVMYQYDTPSLRKILKHSGFSCGVGSFSDIVYLDDLGVQGINIGTGYEGEHSNKCYANLDVLGRQVNRFAHFYKHNKDTKMEHTKPVYMSPSSTSYYPTRYTWMGDYDDLYCYLCNHARGTQRIEEGIWLCDPCFSQADQCQGCGDIFYAYEMTDGLCWDCLYPKEEDD